VVLCHGSACPAIATLKLRCPYSRGRTVIVSPLLVTRFSQVMIKIGSRYEPGPTAWREDVSDADCAGTTAIDERCGGQTSHIGSELCRRQWRFCGCRSNEDDEHPRRPSVRDVCARCTAVSDGSVSARRPRRRPHLRRRTVDRLAVRRRPHSGNSDFAFLASGCAPEQNVSGGNTPPQRNLTEPGPLARTGCTASRRP